MTGVILTGRFGFGLPAALLVLSLSAPLAGCRVFGDGMAWAKDGAPFKIGLLRSAHFLTKPDNGERGGDGLLFLSDEPVECEVLANFGTNPDVEDAFDGNGLIFQVEARFDSGGFDDGADWEGIYLEGESVGAGDDVERGLSVVAFRDGMLFPLGSDGGYYSSGGSTVPAWLDVRTFEDDNVNGKFETLWWRGGFDGARCDQSGGGGETGDFHWETGR